MLCDRCNTEVLGINDDNAVWCENCGHHMKSDIQYVTGYCQSHSCRTQVYCRVKRFGKYVSQVTTDISVLQHYNQILDIYSCFEFAWSRNRDKSIRTYFYAKPVLLKKCCDVMKLKPTKLPGLKDLSRERDQFRELNQLMETFEWKSMNQIKSIVGLAGV
jgi:hypothetical protein